MIRSASVTGAWHGSPRGRCRGCSSFRRVKTQEGFDAFKQAIPPAGGSCVGGVLRAGGKNRWWASMRKRIEALLLGKLERVTPGLPCGGGISTASPAYPPAASDERRSHAAMNCNGKYSDGRCGEPRNGCPHSGTCSFRRPSALRKRRRPANRESLRNIRSEVFYGIDMQERSSLPLAAEPSSARDRYGICVRCLPFISVFGNYIPFYTAVPPKPDCRSGPCPKPPPRRGLGVTPICKRGSAANAPTASRVQRLGKPTECKARYGCLVFLRPESRLQVPVCSRRLCASLCRSTGSGKLRRINPFSAT